jgi:hypothetical protein
MKRRELLTLLTGAAASFSEKIMLHPIGESGMTIRRKVITL